MKERYARYGLYVGSAAFVITLVYFALLADAFYTGGDETTVRQMAQVVPSLPIDLDGSSKENETIVILTPENGMNIASGRIDVKGNAPVGAEVLLFVNGAFAQRVSSPEGTYLFTDVELKKQATILQTRFEGEDGSSASSTAIMVFLQNESAQENNSSDPNTNRFYRATGR